MKRIVTIAVIICLSVCTIHAQKLLSTDNFTWNQHSPIKHLPFTEKEFLRNYKGPAISEMLFLPNGKKISFKEYVMEVNKVEEWLNRMGFSLRTPGENTGLIFRLKVDRKKLEEQKKAFEPSKAKAAIPDFGLVDLHDMGVLKQLAWAAKIMDTIKPDINFHGTFTQDDDSENGDGKTPILYINPMVSNAYVYGSEDIIQASYTSSLTNTYMREYNENPDLRYLQSNILIKSSADITMFGSRFNIFTSSLNPDYQRGPSGMASVSGINGLLQESTTLQASSASNSHQEITGYSASTLIMVGPIPVRFTLSLNGEVGWNWNTTMSESGIYAISSPYFDIGCTGSAAVDVVIAGAGARCDLTVLGIDETIESQIKNSGPSAIESMCAATININTLSGKIELFAYVYYLTWTGFHKKTWTIELADWEGMTFSAPEYPRTVNTEAAYR